MSVTIGLEIGAASVLAVAVDDEGRIAGRGEQPFTSGGAPAAAVAAATAAARAAGVSGVATGVAAYEPRAADTAAVLQALGAAFRVPAPAANLGTATVVGEAWCGAARGVRDVVSLLVGERVAAGVLLGGHPWVGAHGLAGSAAWLALNPVERQDYRQHGCLDAEISARGVARRLAWRVQAGDLSRVVDRAGGLDAVTAQHVYDGARTGDGVAISVVRDTVRYIAMAVANLSAMFDPEMVVLGGDIAAAQDLLVEPVRQECQRRLSADLFGTLRIVASSLGEAAAAIGAARLSATAGP